MTAVLELRKVRCSRGDRLLFDGLSAACAPGTALQVDGPNGSGKTSLLRMIAGLAPPTAGDILWRGAPVARWPEGDERIHLGHAPALKGELTAADNLRAACALAGRPCTAAEASAALSAAGLRGHAGLPARSLSQGQRRRAVLARLALAPRAGLWVLDEPFDALDAAARAWLRDLVSAQLGRGGVVVLTSHEHGPWDSGWPRTTVRLRSTAATAECAA